MVASSKAIASILTSRFVLSAPSTMTVFFKKPVTVSV